jgi:hypothetical protein
MMNFMQRHNESSLQNAQNKRTLRRVRRRAVLTGLMATSAVVGLVGWAAGQTNTTIWYLAPVGRGDVDATDWDNAAPIRRISQIAAQAPAETEFRIGFAAADLPWEWSGQQIRLVSLGTKMAPVRVVFGSLDASNMFKQANNMDDLVTLYMDGDDVDADGRPDVGGQPYAVFGPDTNHVQVSGPSFYRAGGGGFFNIDAGGLVRDFAFSDIFARRAGRVIEAEQTTAIDGLRVERCSAVGLIRGFARFFELHNAHFIDLDLDADYLDGGGGAVCQIISIVRGGNLYFNKVRLAKAVNIIGAQERGSSYIQGDGLVLEEATHDVLIEDCHAEDMGDGGFDLKTDGVTLRNCTTTRCKLGIRIWSHNSANLIEACTMRDPVSRPFNDGSCLWLAGMVTARSCEMHAGGGMSPIRFGAGNDDGREASLKIEGGEITHADGASIVTGSPGEIELENVLVNGTDMSGKFYWTGRRLRRKWF